MLFDGRDDNGLLITFFNLCAYYGLLVIFFNFCAYLQQRFNQSMSEC